jgi:hypothetical protein
MKKSTAIIGLTALGIGTAVISRLIEHPANFVPVAAIAITAAYYCSSRWSWLIPLAAMLISDLFIGLYDPAVMLFVYVSYLTAWGLGRMARSSSSKSALIPATLFGAVTHFTLTNFAVWAFTAMYPKTLGGLALSYSMGIPFFKWTVLGDIFYMTLFTAIIEAVRFMANRAPSRAAVETQQVFYS